MLLRGLLVSHKIFGSLSIRSGWPSLNPRLTKLCSQSSSNNTGNSYTTHTYIYISLVKHHGYYKFWQKTEGLLGEFGYDKPSPSVLCLFYHLKHYERLVRPLFIQGWELITQKRNYSVATIWMRLLFEA